MRRYHSQYSKSQIFEVTRKSLCDIWFHQISRFARLTIAKLIKSFLVLFLEKEQSPFSNFLLFLEKEGLYLVTSHSNSAFVYLRIFLTNTKSEYEKWAVEIRLNCVLPALMPKYFFFSSSSGAKKASFSLNDGKIDLSSDL